MTAAGRITGPNSYGKPMATGDIPGRLPAVALAAALPLPFASLPVFALGYWDKAEPLVVGFHVAAAVAALAVIVELWRRGEPALARIVHPYVLIPLALGVWSVLIAPTREMPLLSLFGAPQSGFGGLWFLDFAVLCAAALLAAQHAAAWRWLGRVAIAVAVAVASVKAWDWVNLHHGGGHLLIYVPGYYGWLAVALPVAVRGRERWAALAAAIAVAIVSANATAIGMLAIGTMIVVIGRRGPAWARCVTFSGDAGGVLVMVVAMAPLIALQSVPWLLEKESLRDRHLVHRMIEAGLAAADPASQLLGHGWGRTQDAFQIWLNVSGERLWSPTWTFLSGDYFHSHSWLLEALYCAGVPGMVLVFAGFVIVPVFANDHCRPLALAFAVAIAGLDGLWFQLSLSLPFMAMAFAAVADRSHLRLRWSPRVVALGIGVLAAIQLVAAAALLSAGLEMSRVRAGLDAVPPRTVPVSPDFRGSDLALAEVLRDHTVLFAQRARSGEPTPAMASALQALLNEVDRRAATTRTVLLLTGGMTAMAQIHVNDALPFAAAEEQISMWRRWLDRLLVMAPERTDQAIPYFTAVLARDRFDEVAEISAAMLARDIRDPVGLYYQGLTRVQQPSPQAKADGLAMVRDAVTAGMDRFMPIDPKLKELLGLP